MFIKGMFWVRLRVHQGRVLGEFAFFSSGTYLSEHHAEQEHKRENRNMNVNKNMNTTKRTQEHEHMNTRTRTRT